MKITDRGCKTLVDGGVSTSEDIIAKCNVQDPPCAEHEHDGVLVGSRFRCGLEDVKLARPCGDER